MKQTAAFDFDHWAELAQRDPARFERDRRLVLARALRQVPVHRRQRLRGLQWRVDQVRLTSRTPMAAYMRISRMMWDSVQGERGLAAVLRDPMGHVGVHGGAHGGPSADVLPFRRSRDAN